MNDDAITIIMRDEGEALSPDAPEGGDYADFLLAYMSHALPDHGEGLSDELIELAAVYLRSLTDEIAPPPPELADRFWAYYNQVARPVDGIEPDLVREQVLFELFPKLTPVDFTPLDPEGTEGAIQKITASREPKGVLESLILLLKGLKKLKELQPPGNLKKKWRRTGPFELLAIEDWHLSKSMPFKDVLDRDVDPWGISALDIKESITVPDRTDVVTVDLKGFVLMTSKNRMRSTLSGGSLVNPQFRTNSGWEAGPIMCRTAVDFNPLKSKTCKLTLRTLPCIFPDGDLSKLFFSVIASANVRFYSAIIDLG